MRTTHDACHPLRQPPPPRRRRSTHELHSRDLLTHDLNRSTSSATSARSLCTPSLIAHGRNPSPHPVSPLDVSELTFAPPSKPPRALSSVAAPAPLRGPLPLRHTRRIARSRLRKRDPLLPATPPPPFPSSLPLHLTSPTPAPAPAPRRSHQTATLPHSILSPATQALVLAISSHPLPTTTAFLASRCDELLRTDITSLLKALELSGHWEWALALLRWAGREAAADASALEMVVRELGHEGQHDTICAVLNKMPLPPGYRLDIRAYTTVLHALSRVGWYECALELFAELRRQGVVPTLVIYNVVLDVYGQMCRPWPWIVALLDEMRATWVELDGFTASTVITACCREGLVDEAVAFFEDLKARGHAPCVVIYNALLQVFGEQTHYYFYGLQILNVLAIISL
jgi:pentatricopeptide repeat protein